MNITRKFFFWQKIKVQTNEFGLHFIEDEFKEVLKPGTYWFFDPKKKHSVEVSSQLQPWLLIPKLEEIIFSGKLKGLAEVIDLKDNQRALVWVDGRFNTILFPGYHVYWLGPKNVSVEIIDTKDVRFQHDNLTQIAQSAIGKLLLNQITVPPYHVGLLYYDEKFTETLTAGLYAFWKNTTEAKIVNVYMRERVIDITGQELMTADKVTLRMNANVVFQVVDAEKMTQKVEDVLQVLYREAQLALRNVVGRRELEQFLSDKNEIALEAEEMLKTRADSLGVKVLSFGIRDVILPGEMKDLLNKVTEAKKAAEANLIARREETAAMRSQANTAKLLENNPTLMRLRELEVLEKIVASGKLQVIVGEKGLADRVVNLL
ncbi:MAG: slipin family protein [Planctomycetaceae bacterium]|jgi:regulator of protease activity HflC (stomatin/prohibitin superfamily)|nr:slipin family protein [Planctomycetaceae bacterium]